MMSYSNEINLEFFNMVYCKQSALCKKEENETLMEADASKGISFSSFGVVHSIQLLLS